MRGEEVGRGGREGLFYLSEELEKVDGRLVVHARGRRC